jgi:hypothetical protein
MSEPQGTIEQVAKEVQNAAQGAGPLLQRDYWAVIDDSKMTPAEIVELVRTHFSTFAPKGMAAFTVCGDTSELAVDREMDIEIPMAGACRVRAVHMDDNSLTLRTLEGHPEAGRITFGAEYDHQGRVVFRIRSRARAGSVFHLLGYNLVGQTMQTSVWLTFVERVAAACNGTLFGDVQQETEEVSEGLADQGELDTPTFVAHRDVVPEKAA